MCLCLFLSLLSLVFETASPANLELATVAGFADPSAPRILLSPPQLKVTGACLLAGVCIQILMLFTDHAISLGPVYYSQVLLF